MLSSTHVIESLIVSSVKAWPHVSGIVKELFHCTVTYCLVSLELKLTTYAHNHANGMSNDTTLSSKTSERLTYEGV